MDNVVYVRFFELLDKIVNEDVDWTKKMEAFTEFMSQSEKYQRDLDEFLSWIEP